MFLLVATDRDNPIYTSAPGDNPIYTSSPEPSLQMQPNCDGF